MSTIRWIAVVLLPVLCQSAALAADLRPGLPPYESLGIGPPPVPVPVAVPVPVPPPAVVAFPDPFGFFPPPPRLPAPNLFSTRIYYMQPPPKYAAEPRDGADGALAEEEHYGYGRTRPPPHPVGFYGPGGVD